MGTFKHRYLFFACLLSMFIISVGYFLSPTYKIIFSILLLLLSFSLFLYACIFKKRITIKIFAVILMLFILLSSFVSFRFFDVYLHATDEYIDKDVIIYADIISDEYAGKNMCGYNIKVHAIKVAHDNDIKNVSFNARLECMFESELQAGDSIYILAKASSLDSQIYESGNKAYYLSDGINTIFTVYSDSDYKVAGEHVNVINDINFKISYYLRNKIGSEEGNLASALLLGNRHLLSSSTVRDFSRAGVSHILALSGMHMTIIMGAVAYILRKMRVGRIPRAVTLTAFSVFYLLLTGCSLSALRSVIMLLCVYLSDILGLTNDSLTSLSVAGMVILMFSPQSVFDAGFWMSFAATFGILLFSGDFSELINYLFDKTKLNAKVKKVFIYVITLIFTSVFAVLGLIVVLCIFTHEYSLYSVLSSFVLALPTEGMLILSLLLLIFGNIPYIGSIILFLLSRCASFMLEFTGEISKKENIVLSFNYSYIKYFAYAFIILFFFIMLVKFKKKFVSYIIIGASVSVFILTVCVTSYVNCDRVNCTYINASSESDIMVISKGQKSVVVDVSNGSNSSLRKATMQMTNDNSSEIQAYIITDYITYHIQSLSRLFKSERVHEIWIPKPFDKESYYIMKAIIKRAGDENVAVKIYDFDKELCVFGDTYINIKSEYIERSKVPLNTVSIKRGSTNMLYISPCFSETDSIYNELYSADTLIIGARGPRVKKYYSLENASKLQSLIICDIERGVYLDTKSVEKDLLIYVGYERRSFILQ